MVQILIFLENRSSTSFLKLQDIQVIQSNIKLVRLIERNGEVRILTNEMTFSKIVSGLYSIFQCIMIDKKYLAAQITLFLNKQIEWSVHSLNGWFMRIIKFSFIFSMNLYNIVLCSLLCMYLLNRIQK